MLFEFLQNASYRHLNETLPIISQLTDGVVMSEPLPETHTILDINILD